MRVLVTGGAGFVGGYLLRELSAAGHEVWATSLDGAPAGDGGDVHWLPLDVTSAAAVTSAVERSRPEGVVHLAAQASVGASFHDPLGTWDVNATGTLRLVQALPQGVRLLLVSSAEVYGVVPDDEQPIHESRPLRPANPYAASKAAAEMAVLQAGLRGAVDAVVARSFNHTGPGQDVRFAIPSFARQLAALGAGEGRVLQVGNLEARRDFLDVRDVVRAYRTLLEHGEPGQVYNVCSGSSPRLRELVDELVAMAGGGIEVRVDPARVRPIDVPRLQGDGARLRALGWSPEIALRDTLRDLLRAQQAPS